MSLTLKIISYKGLPPEVDLEKSFGREGGTLGRSAEKRKNHFTLNDPAKYISRQHARVTFEKGSYYLTDTSLDGTYIVNKDKRVSKDTIPLADGDTLRIGEYELMVRILSGESPCEPQGPVGDLATLLEIRSQPVQVGFDQPEQNPVEKCARIEQCSSPSQSSVLDGSFDLPDIAYDADADADAEDQLPQNFDFAELIADPEATDRPPDAVRPLKGSIPLGHSTASQNSGRKPSFNGRPQLANIDKNLSKRPPAEPEQPIEESAKGQPGLSRPVHERPNQKLWEAFLEGAGINDPGAASDEDAKAFMKMVGTLLRQMVAGLTDLLQGRAGFKSEFRLSATMINASDNNPLKFFKTPDEILHQLLFRSNPGFVDTRVAVPEVVTDIKQHQMAMAAGIQAAILSFYQRFDPRHFARKFEEGVVFQRKAKSWDAFEQSYAQMADGVVEEFFGEAFVHAYEKQIQRLRRNSNDG